MSVVNDAVRPSMFSKRTEEREFIFFFVKRSVFIAKVLFFQRCEKHDLFQLIKRVMKITKPLCSPTSMRVPQINFISAEVKDEEVCTF